MKQTRHLLVAGAIALVAGVFSACGGGSGAGSNIPTDGPFGEIPSVAAKYLPEINQLQEQRWKSSSAENREEIAKKEDALKAKWDEAIRQFRPLRAMRLHWRSPRALTSVQKATSRLQKSPSLTMTYR